MTWLVAEAEAQDTPSLRRGKSEQGATHTAPTVQPAAALEAEKADPSLVTVILTYQDAELAPLDLRGGGMVNPMQNVAERIAKSGLGQGQHAGLIVQVKPRYERIGYNTSTYVVKLEVGAPTLAIDPRIKPDIQRRLQDEARSLLAKLTRWSHPMSEEETRQLLGYIEKVDIALAEPFYDIRTWSYRPVTLTVTLKAPVGPTPYVHYVAFSAEGEREVLYELPAGRAFWVEARFDEPPNSEHQVATLEWPNGSVEVPLSRTEDILLIYRSGPYYVAPPPEQPESASALEASEGEAPAP